MDNKIIADNFLLLSRLMDIHGDNNFKVTSYSVASFTIKKLPAPLSTLSEEKIYAIKGIGEAIGKKIIEQIETGQLQLLNEYIAKTPAGIVEMLGIKGIGPKKITTIWKELEIETLGELMYACNENRLTLYKGFGEKTQKNIKEAIEFYLNALGSYLYQQIESFALALDEKLKEQFVSRKFSLSASFRRQMEVIEKLEWVTTTTVTDLKLFFLPKAYEITEETTHYISFKSIENITVGFYCCPEELYFNQLFLTSCSEEFLTHWNNQTKWDTKKSYASEEAIFSSFDISFIPPCEREKASILKLAKNNQLPDLIQTPDIKGIIHCHSKWSDGSNTLEEMANAAVARGYQYLVISDHSKSAFYASGLYEEKIIAQHQQINELNQKLFPFKIFKGIESDILNDGNLDYSFAVLSTFDLVIASIHSNLKMTEEKAMLRLMKAIENPYTAILGHMTGRLLLSRDGYPIDHKKIIEACADHQVVIELNANPRRLDMDWRWINYALEKNVLISINPDAHKEEGYEHCRYGILVAQKAGLNKEMNLSSFSLPEFEQFVSEQKKKRNHPTII